MYQYGDIVILENGQKMFIMDNSNGTNENYGLLEDGSELMISEDEVDEVLLEKEFVINVGEHKVMTNKETGEKVLFYNTKFNKSLARNEAGKWVKVNFDLYDNVDDKTFAVSKRPV